MKISRDQRSTSKLQFHIFRFQLCFTFQSSTQICRDSTARPQASVAARLVLVLRHQSKVMAAELVGRWRLDKCHNCSEFLRAYGTTFVKRQLAARLPVIHDISLPSPDSIRVNVEVAGAPSIFPTSHASETPTDGTPFRVDRMDAANDEVGHSNWKAAVNGVPQKLVTTTTDLLRGTKTRAERFVTDSKMVINTTICPMVEGGQDMSAPLSLKDAFAAKSCVTMERIFSRIPASSKAKAVVASSSSAAAAAAAPEGGS